MRKHKLLGLIICEKCEYEWYTRSKRMYITCPMCRRKVKNPNAQPITVPPQPRHGSAPAECPYCKYKWYTRSVRMYLSCPNCTRVFRRR
ncbi:MAG: hypothetical protein QW697_07610 [Acidilobaceae archaeon]